MATSGAFTLAIDKAGDKARLGLEGRQEPLEQVLAGGGRDGRREWLEGANPSDHASTSTGSQWLGPRSST